MWKSSRSSLICRSAAIRRVATRNQFSKKNVATRRFENYSANRIISRPALLRNTKSQSNSSSSSNAAKKRLFSSGEGSSEAEEISNKLVEISEKPNGIDTWVRQLTESQQRELAQIVAGHEAGVSYTIPEPSKRDLQLVAMTTAIPFVGFGIMDNAILIIAGDAIDTSLGVVLGISTMCAAAIGNIVSDVAGIVLGTAIEDFCALYLRLPTPNLTAAQRQLRSVRFANQFGCGVGVVIGCIIGMFPLMLIDSNKVQYRKREAHMDNIFKDVVTQARTLVGAARVCLYLRVNDVKNPIPVSDGKFIYVKYDAASAHNLGQASVKGDDFIKQERWTRVGRGIVSRALLTGDSWNIKDAQKEPDFVPDLGYVDWKDATENEGRKTKSMVCVPVMDSGGRPIAVIQAVNKVYKGREDHDYDSENPVASAVAQHEGPRSFSENDVQLLKALASHISVSLQRMYEHAEGEEAEVMLKDTIRLLKDYGLAGIVHEDFRSAEFNPDFTERRPLFPDDVA